MAASSGQAYVYAESEDTFPSNLICAVCHDVCGTHSACPGCQQTFCEVCVHKWFDVQRTTGTNCTCPYCRRKLRFSDLTHDPTIQQQLDQLSVLCPNAPAGCPAVMARADLPAHLQHSCMHEAVSCRFCGQAGVRSEIQEHERSSCRKRLVPCQHAAAGCDAMVPLDDMLQHVELNCSFTCKPCPQCKTGVPRRAWSAHFQDSCPAQQPCPMRLYGCSFVGDAAAVDAHSSSCAYKQHKQQLQEKLGLQTGQSAGSATSGTITAAGVSDSGELPAGCVPDAAAAFKASTARSSDCQVRQCLLDSLPQAANSVLPPRLQQQPQQRQQAGGMTLPGMCAGTDVSIKQLASITPPKVFTAAAAVAAGGTEHETSHDAAEQEGKPTTSSGSCRSRGSDSTGGSMRSAVEQLALGAPGCLAGVGLQPDPLLECAWRIIVNMAVVQVLKVQETAVEQQLSAFMLYSSINRAWDTVLDFVNTLPTAFEEQEDQQGQQQQQQQGQQRQQQQQPAAAAQPAQAPPLPTPQQQLMLLQQQQLLLQQQQRFLQQQQQRLLQQQQQQEGTATGGTGFISAALSSLFGGHTASNGSSNAQPTGPQAPLFFQPATQQQMLQQQWAMQQLRQVQEQRQQVQAQQQQQVQQQQQQQARPQLTGRQIWERMLGGGNSSELEQQQQQQGQPGSRGSNDGSSSSSSTGSSREAYTFQDDGIPGLQRGLYEEEYTDIKWWLVKTIPGRQLMSTVAAAAYSLCLWLSIGGPCFAADAVEGQGVSQVSQLASHRVGTLMVKLLQRAVKYQQREGRKKERGQEEGRESSDSEWRPRDPQREAFLAELQAEDEARRSAAAAAGAAGNSSGSSAAPLMIAVHGLGSQHSRLPPRGSRDGSGDGSSQQQQRGSSGRTQDESWHAFSLLTHEAAATDPADTEERLRIELQLQHLTQQYEGLGASGSGTPLLTMPGEPYAVIKQRLQAIASDGFSVPEHKHIPPWLRGLRPLVALELGSALLLLHDVRADQCELSLIPGVNTHVQHGYRGYWALSVLAGVQAWLGPRFKLSWQALAVLNDMVVLQVNNLCQVLGDSFYDPVQQRVPMSPALALEAARLVLPPGLLAECLPHLLRLSAAYRDVSCEDLSDATWEQLSRKLGLVAELDKLASLVNELLPVTFMDEEDESSSDEYDEDTDSGDTSSAYDDDDTDEDSESESTAGSYETDHEERESSTSEYERSDASSSDGDSAGSDSGSSSESVSGGDGHWRDLAVYEKWLRFGAGLCRRPSIERGVAARNNSTPTPPAAAAAGGGAGSSRTPAAAAAGAGTSSAGASGKNKGCRRGHGKADATAESGRSSDSDSSSSSGEWESADEAEAAELEQELLAERSVGTPRGGSESDTLLSSWARPAAAAAGAGAGAGGGAPSVGTHAPASGGKGNRKDPTTVHPSDSGVGSEGAGSSSQPGKGATAVQAEAEGSAGVSNEAGSDSVDWRQQWASNLLGLSKSAATTAAATAPAPETSSQQQQQGAATAGAGLSPYAAQLLQRACEVARKQPDQLLLEGSLTPTDPGPGASTASSTAAGTNGAAAGMTGGAAAGANGGTAVVQPAVQESRDAAFAGAPSAAALYLRSATLPAADIMAQLAAVHDDGTAAASGTSGTAGAGPANTSAAAAAAGTPDEGDGTGPSTTAAAGASTAGTAPAAESTERPRRYFMTAPATGAIRERRHREGRERPGEDGEPGDACTHGVVLLLGLIEVVLKKLLQQAGRVAAADPEVLGISSSSSSSGTSSSSSGVRRGGLEGQAAGLAEGVSEGGVGDGEVLLLQSVQPRVVITAKHVQLAVAQDEDLSKILLQDWPGAPVDCSVCWAGAPPGLDPQLLSESASEPITAFLLHLAQGSWQQQQQAQQRDVQLRTTATSSSSRGRSQAIVFPADLCMYCGETVSMPPAAVPSERNPSEAYGPGQAAAAAASPGATPSAAAAAVTAAAGTGAAAAAECEGPSATCCFMSGWHCSLCAAQTADLAAAGLEAQLQACKQALDGAVSAIAQQQHQQQQQQQEEGVVDQTGVAALTEEQLQQLMTATRLFHLQQPNWFDGVLAGGSDNATTPSSSSSRAGTKLSASSPGLSQTQGPWDAVDRVQLQQMEPLLQPLRDVVALREAHLQQQQSQPALPAELFDQLVQDAVCDVMSKRQQQKQQEETVREQLRRLMGPSAGSSSSAAAAGASGSGSGSGSAAALRSPARPLGSVGSPARTPGRGRAVNQGGQGAPSTPAAAAAAGRGLTATSATEGSGVEAEIECELTMQADAMQLLQQAAEDFLVQQFAGANRLALHAGRQEVGPQDLRLALQTSGYGHLLPGVGRNSRVAAGAGAGAGSSSSRAGVGSSKKGRRGLGAGFFMS